MSSSNGQRTTDGTKRRKRIITEARKEQNRTAQQLYRQRQRERRMHSLQSHKSSSTAKVHHLRPHQPCDAGLGSGRRSTANGVGATTETQSSDDTLFEGIALQSNSTPPLEHVALLQGHISGFDFNIDELTSLPISSTPISDGRGSGSGLLVDPIYGGTAFAGSSSIIHENFMNEYSASNFSGSSFTNRFPCAATSSAIWPASMNATPLRSYEPASLQLCSPNFWKIPDASQMSQSNLEKHGGSWNPLKEAPFNQIPGAEETIYSTARFVYGRQMLTETSSGSGPALPDPYINFILCSLGASLLAYFHNARCIGLEPQDVLVNRSPFYNPGTKAADHPQALLAAARKPWIPVHLQPTLPQILFPHHPYLDLIPFPTLRARAVTFGATTPQFFDWMEFKKDVFKDGLYCFRDADRGGSKQPWDMRSWEAAPWFARKWRLLME